MLIMNKKKQLRGQALLNAIEQALLDLTTENDKYVYNESELSRRVGCSRPTLDKHAEFIDSVLTKIGAEKRLKKDHPLMAHLYTRIENLESENDQLQKELLALRSHHAKIYSLLFSHSVDMSIFVRPIVENQSIVKGKCILCDSVVKENHIFPRDNKVIQLSDHKK